jgi:hypothetical protein
MPYTPDLTETAVREVTRALAQPARFPLLDSFDEMRQRAADNIVTLAFRRYLAEQDVPYETVESVNFTEPDQYDISFGGRRCIPFAQLICDRGLIEQTHRQPEKLLEGNVYIPEGTPAAATRDVDIYLFVSLTALVARGRDESEAAHLAGHPLYLVYQMPESWSIPKERVAFRSLVFKTDTAEPAWLELHGQNELNGYQRMEVSLPGHERMVVQTPFYSLGAVRSAGIPSGPVGIHSPALDDTVLVSPFQWGNIWVYGMRLYMVGYITQADFNRQAQRVYAAQEDLHNPCLQGETVMRLPAAALKPVDDLFVRVRNWARMKGS